MKIGRTDQFENLFNIFMILIALSFSVYETFDINNMDYNNVDMNLFFTIDVRYYSNISLFKRIYYRWIAILPPKIWITLNMNCQ